LQGRVERLLVLGKDLDLVFLGADQVQVILYLCDEFGNLLLVLLLRGREVDLRTALSKGIKSRPSAVQSSSK
jgi:hypothetical protein